MGENSFYNYNKKYHVGKVFVGKQLTILIYESKFNIGILTLDTLV